MPPSAARFEHQVHRRLHGAPEEAEACPHDHRAQAWTLDELAREAGVSRSALVERFTKSLGVAPMSYLTDWRLELGDESLRSTSRSVQSVAIDVGYESEAAFNRACKRKFAVPPARYRRDCRERTKRSSLSA